MLDRAARQGTVRVIVGLKTAAADGRTSAAFAAAQDAFLRRLGLSAASGGRASQAHGVVRFETMPFVSLEASPALLRQILNDPGVESVQHDVPQPLALARSRRVVTAHVANAAGFTGRGYAVAVIDSGIDRTHPMLRGKVIAEACYSTTLAGQSTSLCPGGVSASVTSGSGQDCDTRIEGCGHGTHVASVAAGRSASLKGVAPGALLIAIKVASKITGPANCDGAPSCLTVFTTDELRGLERVLFLSSFARIAAVNVSIAGGSFSSACDDVGPALTAVIEALRDAGVATVAGTGNDGSTGAIGVPACISTVVAVGSTTKRDVVSSFSNHSSLVDLLAPGESIRAAFPGGRLRSLTGTSFATPHVAGAFAVLRQAKPDATVEEITEALAQTGRLVERDGITKPRIDIAAALMLLRSR